MTLTLHYCTIFISETNRKKAIKEKLFQTFDVAVTNHAGWMDELMVKLTDAWIDELQ